MKKYEILYDWPCIEISHLADSEIADDFAAQLREPNLTSFVDVTESLRRIGATLVTAKADRQHFGSWRELRELLARFETEFPTFPNQSISKFILLTIFAEKLDPTFAPLDATDIDEAAFSLLELSNPIPLAWFVNENSLSFLDSIAIFKCSNPAEVEAAVASSNLSPVFIFHLLAALCQKTPFPTTQAGLVKDTAAPIDMSSVEAYLRIKVLASGKAIHVPKQYANPISVLNPDSIAIGPPFQQWGDAISVLSEYNSRDEVLIKYLTIYHVIENFMFKRPIVELEQQNNGYMFSIRDFRRLYSQADIGEKKALKLLFDDILQMESLPGITFKQHISTQWVNMVAGAVIADVDTALTVLDTGFTSAEFQTQLTADRFAALVYTVRNAIVHNKETEFHLTYASMSPTMGRIIETFLIPRLEEISFSVIGKQTTKLWYRNRELRLYQ